jgi:arylsulfatase A-like enzyme
MIWRFPDAWNLRGIVDEGFVSSVDVAPTVAALAGAAGPFRMQGRPLVSREGVLRPVPARGAALTEWRGEKLHQGAGAPPTPAVRCLTTERWKLVHYEGKDFGELYDLRNDPCELRNLWAVPAKRKVVREMRERLLGFVLDAEPLPPKTDLF